jgi:hypothetical protein
MTLEINIAHARLGFTTIKYIVICWFEPQQGVSDILFLKLSIKSGTVGPQCGSGVERLEMFVYCEPVRTKLKWSVPIKEHALYQV